MKFYTKAWKDYIYNNWKVAIEYCFFVTAAKNLNNSKDIIYDGIYSDRLRDECFNKYYELKKRYVSSLEEISKNNDKYEKVELLSIDKEKELYNIRIDESAKLNKNKLLEVIKILEDNEIKIDLNINDVDFKLLALGKVNSKTFDFYKNLRDVFCKLLEENQELIKEYTSKLKNFELIVVNTNAFLTSYTSYLNSKNDNFYDFEKNLSFHDSDIIKYEFINNKLIIEIDWDVNRGIRLIIDNPKIKYYQEIDNDFQEVDIEFDQDDIRDIYSNYYYNYEDTGKCLVLEFFVKINGKYELIKGEYESDMISGEKIIINEKYEKYVIRNDLYQENLKTISKIINEELYQLLKEPYFNKLSHSSIESYNYNKDLILNYKSFNEEKFSLKFINANIRFLKDEQVITKEVLFNILKERLDKSYYENMDFETYLQIPYSISFVKNNNLIESRILVNDDIEVVIMCENIKLLNNNFKVKTSQIKIIG